MLFFVRLVLDLVELPHDVVDFLGLEFCKHGMEHLRRLAGERGALRKGVKIIGIAFGRHGLYLRKSFG